MFKVTGTVVFNDFEGGFWGIQGDDGKKYCPIEMPGAYRREGLRVRATLQRVSIMSLTMWGINVTVERITPLAQ